ncbi:MAG: TIGR02147 family protein [Pseudobdellovibrionaceae bacterium]
MIIKDKSIFNFSEYKAYLKHLAGATGTRKGLRIQFAEAIRAKPAFVSQVLNGDSHLSFEQADALNSFLAHSTDEAEFFFLLLHLERAGTVSLRAYWKNKIAAVLEKRKSLTERLGRNQALSISDQNIYYSSWIYCAVHVATSIPGLQTPESISSHLKISLKKVLEVLQELVSMGLVGINEIKYVNLNNNIRLGRESHNIVRHHSNWRTLVLRSIETNSQEDLHFTGCYSLSKNDIQIIRDNLIDNLKSQLAIIKQSPEEELVALNIDFFRV